MRLFSYLFWQSADFGWSAFVGFRSVSFGHSVLVGRFWTVGFGRSAFVGFRSVGFGRSVLVGQFWTVGFCWFPVGRSIVTTADAEAEAWF